MIGEEVLPYRNGSLFHGCVGITLSPVCTDRRSGKSGQSADKRAPVFVTAINYYFLLRQELRQYVERPLVASICNSWKVK